MVDWRRRVLYHPNRVRAMPARMRADLHDMDFTHLCELDELRRELDEVRDAYAELRAAVLARRQAEAELTTLYREREIARARAAERDLSQPLQ